MVHKNQIKIKKNPITSILKDEKPKLKKKLYFSDKLIISQW
jgi:hypothetical protein